MTPLQTSVQGGNIQTGFNQGGSLTSNVQGGQVQNQIADAGNVQTNLNYGSQFNPGDFNQAAQQASNSAYQAAAARLDPQYAQMQSDLQSRLANSGISENSDAYRREMDNFARQRTDAYGQAQNAAYAQGLAAQNQGYNQALGTRQQNTNETTQQGQFANNAQGQIFGQNAAQLQAFNNAQDQQFSQGQQNANLNNAAQGQQFSQNQSAAGFNNTAQNQAFNQGLSNAQLNNTGRQQQIQEASYLRNLPLNDIAALLGTGGGVQNPTFNQYAQVGVAAPDYQGAVYNNYNAQMQQYNQAQANRSAGLGSIFGTLGTAAGAIFSDRRVKHDIKRIGTLANGMTTYTFKYIWDNVQRFGIMAQEALDVIPDAVTVAPNGMMQVDYGRVWQ